MRYAINSSVVCSKSATFSHASLAEAAAPAALIFSKACQRNEFGPDPFQALLLESTNSIRK